MDGLSIFQTTTSRKEREFRWTTRRPTRRWTPSSVTIPCRGDLTGEGLDRDQDTDKRDFRGCRFCTQGFSFYYRLEIVLSPSMNARLPTPSPVLKFNIAVPGHGTVPLSVERRLPKRVFLHLPRVNPEIIQPFPVIQLVTAAQGRPLSSASSLDILGVESLPPRETAHDEGHSGASDGNGERDLETGHVADEDAGEIFGRERAAKFGGAGEDEHARVDMGRVDGDRVDHGVDEGGLGCRDEERSAYGLED